MKIKKLTPLVVALALTACGGESATTEEPQEEKQVAEEVNTAEESQEEVEVENPYEETAKFAFGEDVQCDVIEIQDENGKPKVTRINITYSGEPNVNPFLSDVFTYLKKIKEKKLDYESVFFILKAKKTDGKEYPYAKIEVTKEAVDNFDFDTKNPTDLKSIAKTYDAPDDNETSDNNNNNAEISSNENIDNEDLKTVVTAFAQAQFKDFCDVSTETKENLFVIHLYPKNDDLKAEITGLILDTTNPQLLSGWEQMKEGLVEFSKSVNNEVSENVSVMLHNPVNHDMVLLVILNDTVMSDFTKE